MTNTDKLIVATYVIVKSAAQRPHTEALNNDIKGMWNSGVEYAGDKWEELLRKVHEYTAPKAAPTVAPKPVQAEAPKVTPTAPAAPKEAPKQTPKRKLTTDGGASAYIPFIGGAVDSARNPHAFREPGVDSGEASAGFGGGVSGGLQGGVLGAVLGLLRSRGKSVGGAQHGLYKGILDAKNWAPGAIAGGTIGSSIGTGNAALEQRKMKGNVTHDELLNLLNNKNT